MADKVDPTKYLRENLTDLEEYAKRKLAQTDKKKKDDPNVDASDWNIRNWGNFWDHEPAFDNH